MKLLPILLLQLLLGLQLVSGQGKVVSSAKAGETCPFLEGVFVSVMRRIFSQGFHKQLLSEVELMLTTTLLPDKCQLLVEETMPRGAYVDPDEMRDLRFKTGLRSFIPVKVDVEKPEFESEAFRIFIYRTLKVRENLRVTSVQIPVKIRYHKPDSPPSDGSPPMETVKIQNPRLMISCPQEDMLTNCSSRKVMAFCDETGSSKCEWINIPYKINVASVEVSIPVGNTEHTSMVVGVTTLVTCGATIYLIITMFREVKPKVE